MLAKHRKNTLLYDQIKIRSLTIDIYESWFCNVISMDLYIFYGENENHDDNV